MKNYLAFAWLLCSFASCIPVLGQEQPQPEAIDSQATVQMAGENDPAAGQQTASANQPPRFTGRLPRFFSRLVDATQRAKIYQIQQGFFAQKQELEQRLLALRQAENEAMQAVLTDEQRAQLEQLQMASAAQAKGTRSSAEAAGETPPGEESPKPAKPRAGVRASSPAASTKDA